MNRPLLSSLGALLGALALAGEAAGAITIYAEYNLGEPGSLGANNTPLDSIGTRHINKAISGGASSVGSPDAYAVSTAFLDTSGETNIGFYSLGNYGDLATDNVAIGVYAKASSLDVGNRGTIFGTGDGGGFDLGLHTNRWAGSLFNVAWVGPEGGVAGSFTADSWVHLALIRADGVTTLYIDGVPQAGTLATPPAHSSPHISVSPGGFSYFGGGIDAARVVTFGPGDSTTDVLNVLTRVPEPSSVALLGLGAMALSQTALITGPLPFDADRHSRVDSPGGPCALDSAARHHTQRGRRELLLGAEVTAPRQKRD